MNSEASIGTTRANWRRAGRVELRASMTVAEGFETVVASCITHFRLSAPLVVQRRSATALHQTRVALRRLRSAFSLFKPAIADREFNRLDDELNCFAAATGDARNFDVYLLRDLDEAERRLIEQRRDEAYDGAIAVVSSAHARRLLADITAWAAVGAWRSQRRAKRPLKRFMKRRIDKLWKKTCGTRRVADIGDSRRHRLRIRVKKLRYAIDFARGLHERHHKRRKAFLHALKLLQDALGALNDAAVARRLATDSTWPGPPAPAADERPLLRDAKAALKRLRKIGPYW